MPEEPIHAGTVESTERVEGNFVMQLEESDLVGVLKRLKRAQGRDCKEVVTQLAAVSKALDRAGFAVIAVGLRQCITADPEGTGVDTSSLEKLFLSLA